MSKRLFDQVKLFPWHPYLLAIFPPLALLSINIAEIKVTEVLRSFLLVLVAAILLTAVLKLLLKDIYIASAISSFILIMFFSYGHIYDILKTYNLAGFPIGRHRVLAPIFLIILSLGVWWIARSSQKRQVMTQALNLIALTAVLLPVLQISTYYFQNSIEASNQKSNAPANVQLAGDQNTPDIYYIILDAYSRDDILETFYDLDNSAFLKDLTDLGFYVARCSQSNYAQTQLSLASALNMNFVSELSGYFSANQTKRVGLPRLIKHSAVRSLLESLGYKTIAFETGYYWTQVEDADIYLSPASSKASLLDVTGGFNGFESLLIKTSALLIAVDGASALPDTLQLDIDHPDQIHRQRILYTLDQLNKLPALAGPKFVFAHIVSPHKPFVFDSQGERVNQVKDEIAGYRDQVMYLNSRLVPLVETLISESSRPPIIILQGDHGGLDTSVEDRMAILNAYYLPGAGEQLLYENITPINTFRLIFNQYFGSNFELLDDTSYFSSYQKPYQYSVIPNTRSGCP